MMLEYNFGQLSKRQLCLRFFVPLVMCDWCDDGWRVSLVKLLNPRRWLNTIRWNNWRCNMARHAHVQHRCYCPTGWLFDGHISAAGFGVSWFYSSFTGKTPCPCDLAFDGIDRDNILGGEVVE